MIPNAIPICFGPGLAGFLDLLLSNAGIHIAVDGTIHFGILMPLPVIVVLFRAEVPQSRTRPRARGPTARQRLAPEPHSLAERDARVRGSKAGLRPTVGVSPEARHMQLPFYFDYA
jgi:hypothetical protein